MRFNEAVIIAYFIQQHKYQLLQVTYTYQILKN